MNRQKKTAEASCSPSRDQQRLKQLLGLMDRRWFHSYRSPYKELTLPFKHKKRALRGQKHLRKSKEVNKKSQR